MCFFFWKISFDTNFKMAWKIDLKFNNNLYWDNDLFMSKIYDIYVPAYDGFISCHRDRWIKNVMHFSLTV